MKKLRDLKKQNKGSSIVMVLITMAFIGILAAIILLVCLLNFKMKMIDTRAKDTFYSAETAMDEIKAGLQIKVSSALTESYVEVMQQYSATTEDERATLFQNNYATRLKDSLEDQTKAGSNVYYDMSEDTGLKSYISQGHRYDSESGTGVVIGALENKVDAKDPILATTTSGVLLKNVKVTYYADNDYVSSVEADILLAFPDISFTQTSKTPNLLTYAMVANTSLTSKGGSSTISGNLYAGKNGMTVKDSSALSIKNANTIVTNSDITLEKGSVLETDKESGLWAKNIDVTSATLKLDGVTHVANDLVVDDEAHGESTIKLAGRYFGYGNPATVLESNYAKDNSSLEDTVSKNEADYSSAILIKGTNVGMDLSSLSELMLSGNAYIGVSSSVSTPKNGNDIRMGESLTVKSNQLAYLVPDDLVGVGSVYGGSNPMTELQYDDLVKDVGGANNVVSMDGLKERSKDENVKVQTAYYQSNGTSLVYLYIVFDNEDAQTDYFRNYYAANKDKLGKYLKIYSKGISLANDSSCIFNLYGNVMEYQGEISVKNDTKGDDETSDAMNASTQASMQDMFAALGTKLITSYVDLDETTEKGKEVFSNLVWTNGNKESSSTQQTLEDAVYQYGKEHLVYGFETQNTNLLGVLSTAKTIHVKAGERGTNNVDYIEVTNAANGEVTLYVGQNGSTVSKQLRAIVTTGDVVVDNGCEYHGLIFAQGSVTLDGNASVESAATDVAKVLQAQDLNHKIGENHITMMYYLKESKNYVLAGAANGVADQLDNHTSVDELVRFRNWTKK